jgi:hypothetical protein
VTGVHRDRSRHPPCRRWQPPLTAARMRR